MARDPYEVLGINQTATADEIKKAYRGLVKKYHPDNYKDNPLEDLAKEKMQEINEAYESIQDGKTSNGQGNYRTSNPYGQAGGQTDWQRQWQQQQQQRTNSAYGTQNQNQGPYYSNGCSSGSVCDSLSCLCCADSCCECMGGDICSCC